MLHISECGKDSGASHVVQLLIADFKVLTPFCACVPHQSQRHPVRARMLLEANRTVCSLPPSGLHSEGPPKAVKQECIRGVTGGGPDKSFDLMGGE